MILKAICDRENPALFDLYRARYNQEDIFVSYTRGASMKHFYDGRYGSGRYFHMKAWRKPEDENYLVGTQEVSHYGGY